MRVSDDDNGFDVDFVVMRIRAAGAYCALKNTHVSFFYRYD